MNLYSDRINSPTVGGVRGGDRHLDGAPHSTGGDSARLTGGLGEHLEPTPQLLGAQITDQEFLPMIEQGQRSLRASTQDASRLQRP